VIYPLSSPFQADGGGGGAGRPQQEAGVWWAARQLHLDLRHPAEAELTDLPASPGVGPTGPGYPVIMSDDRHHTGQTNVPDGTAPTPPAMPGTSDATDPATQRPDLEPGGPDVDESDQPLPGRGRITRNPNPDR
jgi:hypothetical protein